MPCPHRRSILPGVTSGTPTAAAGSGTSTSPTAPGRATAPTRPPTSDRQRHKGRPRRTGGNATGPTSQGRRESLWPPCVAPARKVGGIPGRSSALVARPQLGQVRTGDIVRRTGQPRVDRQVADGALADGPQMQEDGWIAVEVRNREHAVLPGRED